MQLRYKTFDTLMASIKEDLHLYDDNNLIKDYRYIKTARKCNADLGLKMNKFDSTIIQIENYQGSLPKDFYKAFVVYGIWEESIGITTTNIGGNYRVYTKEEIIAKGIPDDYCCSDYADGKVFLVKKCDGKEYMQHNLKPLLLSSTSIDYCTKDSPNLKLRDTENTYKVDITSNEIFTDFKEGQIYLEYMCDMVDEQGNLLVLDHVLTDSFYELQIKEKILTDIAYNKEADVSEILKDVRNNLSIESNKAKSIMNRPSYKKMNEYTKNKQRELYEKHIKMF